MSEALPTTSPAPMPVPSGSPSPESPRMQAWRRLRRNRLAMVCGVGLLVIVALCIMGPWLSSFGQTEQDLGLSFSPPTPQHWLGTDATGRDLMVRIMGGGRISLAVGILATLVSLFIGVAWGAVAGWFGGRIDSIMMRTVDILYALPFTIIVILLIVALEPKIKSGQGQLLVVFTAIGAIEWLTMARVVRGQVLGLKNQEFVTAAKALGVPWGRIVRRHIVPNVMGSVIVCATLNVPQVMLVEGVLSYLGLGIKAPAASWGVLIKEGAEAMESYPWLLFFPALFFAATLFCLNFLGDGLRDALDPKSKRGS